MFILYYFANNGLLVSTAPGVGFAEDDEPKILSSNPGFATLAGGIGKLIGLLFALVVKQIRKLQVKTV